MRSLSCCMRKPNRLMHSALVDLMMLFQCYFFFSLSFSQSNKHFSVIIMDASIHCLVDNRFSMWTKHFSTRSVVSIGWFSHTKCVLAKRDFICVCIEKGMLCMVYAYKNKNSDAVSNRSKIMKTHWYSERAEGRCRCAGVKLKFITSCVVSACVYVTATKIWMHKI